MLREGGGLRTGLWRPALAGVLLLLIGSLALGCHTDRPSDDPELGPLTGELRLAPVPALRLGGLDAGGDQSFGRVRAARFVDDSLIAVVDGLRDQIRLFDRDGALRRGIGGPGDGPGEFRSLRDAVVRRGRGHAWDAMAWRLSRFEPDGKFVDAANFRGAGGIPRFVGVLADGSWLVRSHPANPALGSKEGVVREPASFLLISPAGDVLRRDSRPGLEMLYETVRGRKMGSSLLLSPNTLAAAVGDLVVYGESGTGRLEAVDASGAVVAEGRLLGMPRKATEAELTALQARHSIPTPPAELGVRVPETSPPRRRAIFPRFDRLLVDAGDRLWIRETAGPFDETRRWWRFGPDLRPAGALSVDADVELLDVRGREALVMTTDSLDVATVALRELTEVGGAAPHPLHADVALEDSLTAWLVAHPDATLEQAADQGNELIARVGFPFDVEVDEGVRGTARTGDTLRVDTSKGPVRLEVAWEGDPCGRAFVYDVPVVRAEVGRPRILTSDGPAELRSDELRLQRARVFDPERGVELPAIAVPRERYGNPHRLARGGASLRWRVRLDDAEAWWSGVRERVEVARTFDTPHLVLEISADGSLRFDAALDPDEEPLRTRDIDRVRAAFERLVGDFFDSFDGAAFFSDGAFVVYDHPCT